MLAAPLLLAGRPADLKVGKACVAIKGNQGCGRCSRVWRSWARTVRVRAAPHALGHRPPRHEAVVTLDKAALQSNGKEVTAGAGAGGGAAGEAVAAAGWSGGSTCAGSRSTTTSSCLAT
eukprot:CAMPEP_0168479512 /NCGR_PEP_ID=MMETSP0228-20121227/63510_1 /TAXON_ID=133427 /ORGANISM="Protoceratium reticulatum, Strain CCCM 535 (=CCMP 1889)" /LENGTH=118 /DNA_ID=CAMNT_0008495803 /DNA_START=507 /DNA_END=861 /DNA_ORIENTATION=-